MYWRRIRLAKRLKSLKRLRLIKSSFVTGVGINFRPLDNKVICSSVNYLSDRFLICCMWSFAGFGKGMNTFCADFSNSFSDSAHFSGYLESLIHLLCFGRNVCLTLCGGLMGSRADKSIISNGALRY